METGGDVESLGRRVTAAVVHAIFAIIMIDALFALVYTPYCWSDLRVVSQ